MVAYARRPGQLSGCSSRWQEQDASQVIRTQMDTGAVKVRRRTTGVRRVANIQMIVMRASVQAFWDWFRVSCGGGITPTNFIEPDGTESIWRFIEPPTVDWNDIEGKYITVNARIERLPGWQTLP